VQARVLAQVLASEWVSVPVLAQVSAQVMVSGEG